MLSLEKEAVHDKLEVDSKFYKVKESEFVQRIQVLNKKLYRISYKCRSELGVVKRDKLDYKITDEEGKIIDIRIKLQQQLHECYNERDLFRKVSRVKKILIDLTDEEIIQGLNEYGKDEELLIEKFTEDSDFLMRIRERIASRKDLRQVESSIDTGQSSQAHNTSNSVKKNFVKTSKFKVDEGLELLGKGDDPSKVFAGWSKARITAFRQIEKKPNAYYYRFNAPGEKQGSGGWSNQEKQTFMSRLAEVGANGQWGIFSMGVPGRVGYQCANFYRHLIKSGDISDPNYKIDDRGELRYLFGKKEGGEGFIRNFARTGHAAAQRDEGKKSKKRKVETLAKDGDEEFFCPGVSHSLHIEDDNPLPDFIDAITLEEVIRPAISPYGHVLGYDTWSRCLSQQPKNTCPFTKKPLSHRDLILLTSNNIDIYRKDML